MPVPMVMPMACRAPRAAPTHHSPSTAQLASLSSAAGRPRRSWMIWRSGMLTQPRFGVSSTMPRLVSSGPGAPTPTPRISAPGTSRRGLGDGALGQPHQPVHHVASRPPRRGSARWPWRAGASRPRPRCRRRGWSRRCQCRVRIARMRLHARHGRHRGGDRLDRQLPHAAVVTQRTDLRPVRGAGAAGERRVLDDPVPRAARAEPERGHRGPEDRHDRRADRGGQVQRRGVVGDQHRRPRDQRRGRPEPERARPRCAPRPGAAATTASASGASSRPPDDHDRRVERGRELGVAGPALGAPDRSRRQRHEPGADPALAEPGVRRGAVVGGELEPDRRRAAPAPSRRAPAAARPRGPRGGRGTRLV